MRQNTPGKEVLLALAEHLNSHLELDALLSPALEMILHLAGMSTGWVVLKGEGEQFYLAAAHGLPLGMEENGRAAFAWGPCACQRMLLKGELEEGVNVFSCERLAQLEPGKRDGLEYHASIPLRSGDKALGILNLAKPGPEPLDAETLYLLTLVGEVLGAAIHRAQLFETVRQAHLEEQKTLVQLGFTLLRARSEEEVARAVVAALLRHAPAHSAASRSERRVAGAPGVGFLFQGRELAWAGARPGLDVARIPLGRRATLVLVGSARRIDRGFLEVAQGLVAEALARIEAEQRAARQAYLDPLTGLANRRAFQERLEYLVRRVRRGRGRRSGGLILLDLDGFKEINDVYGHLTGDRVLEEVARRLENGVRPGDLVARLGGDEFAVLLFDLGQVGVPPAASRSEHRAEVLIRVGERLCEFLEAPISIYGEPHRLTASLGLVVVDGRVGAEEVLRWADLAMYRAKKEVGRRMAFFDAAQEAELAKRLELEQALHKSVAEGFKGFRVVFQPVVELKTGKWRALEALLRFTAPSGEPVSPARFIPLTEELGFIGALGEFVLRKALAHSERTGHRVSVNVSPLELSPGYPERVADCLREMGVGPDRLVLEVTEGTLLRKGAAEVLSHLAGQGIEVWLDDFGSGYSNLEKLALLPLSGFKISHNFTAHLGPNPDPKSPSARLLQGILSLGSALELQVIVEGVETPAQRDYLLSQGFTWAQGYLFSPPLEEEKGT